jgi:predicted transcriptional regulator
MILGVYVDRYCRDFASFYGVADTSEIVREFRSVLLETIVAAGVEGSRPFRPVCRECGVFFEFMKSHLQRAHGLDVETYVLRWNVDETEAAALRGYR